MLDAILAFFSNLLLFTAGIMVMSFWLIIISIVVVEAIDFVKLVKLNARLGEEEI
jgi:membrane protein YqaA with SNARE-associated domain